MVRGRARARALTVVATLREAYVKAGLQALKGVKSDEKQEADEDKVDLEAELYKTPEQLQACARRAAQITRVRRLRSLGSANTTTSSRATAG